ncbi:hypothetical protein COO60DRAFT_1233183 [Scenedesmus sp. NREL 46B-D3]|nr:hypothetical protein COO60DRAFT_1233183 [Scenedesmus sp. NREL 46B-D3]
MQQQVAGSSGVTPSCSSHTSCSSQQPPQRYSAVHQPALVGAALASTISRAAAAAAAAAAVQSPAHTTSTSCSMAGAAVGTPHLPSAWPPLQQYLASMAAALLHDVEQEGIRSGLSTAFVSRQQNNCKLCWSPCCCQCMQQRQQQFDRTHKHHHSSSSSSSRTSAGCRMQQHLPPALQNILLQVQETQPCQNLPSTPQP